MSMQFPTSPQNLDQVVVNGNTYVYDGNKQAWVLLTAQYSDQKLATEKKSIAYSIALS